MHERLPGLLSGGAFASTMNSSTALHAGEWRETTGLDHEVNASGLPSVESLDSRLLVLGTWCPKAGKWWALVG